MTKGKTRKQMLEDILVFYRYQLHEKQEEVRKLRMNIQAAEKAKETADDTEIIE